MPAIEVIFFKESDGTEPFREWFEAQTPPVQAKCFRALKSLEDFGYELRRPTADYLRDGIYELRFRYVKVNFRILYFFSGKGVAVVSHGISKHGPVPSLEIDKAVGGKVLFERDCGHVH